MTSNQTSDSMKAASSRTTPARSGHGEPLRFRCPLFDRGTVDKFQAQVGFVFGADVFLGDDLFEGFPGDVFRHPIGRGAVEKGLAGAIYGGNEEFDAR